MPKPDVRVLRLYREVLRTARRFEWPNEQGEPWSKVLQKQARLEIEGARYETVRTPRTAEDMHGRLTSRTSKHTDALCRRYGRRTARRSRSASSSAGSA